MEVFCSIFLRVSTGLGGTFGSGGLGSSGGFGGGGGLGASCINLASRGGTACSAVSFSAGSSNQWNISARHSTSSRPTSSIRRKRRCSRASVSQGRV
jgi:hypothetical protein